jgi:phospholipid/cholesterol/gamma-HCH transport system substrate-binding protein
MDLHYKQEAAVGGVVIVGVVAFILGTMWLGGKSFKSEKLWQARFEDVGKLQEGSVVKISGVKVGAVRRIDFVEERKVLVFFSLPPKVVPHEDASISLEQSIAFSEAILHLKLGESSNLLSRDQPIPGRLETGLFDQVTPLTDQAKTVLQGAQEILNKRTADDLHATLVAMQKMLNTITDKVPGPTAEAEKAMASLRRLSDRFDSTLASPAFKSTMNHLDTASANLSAMSAQFTTTGARLDTLLKGITGGQGTLGKLATDSGFYQDSRAAAQSLKGLLDELQKHPGKIVVQVKIF